MNSATGGNIIFHFKGDTSNLNKSMTGVSSGIKGMTKSILVATGITKGLSATFNLMRNSAGKAIDRIDTFNAFPKVLSNFGVSADEAKKSIDRIDKSVRGLPTSLDQAVAGVQNIFMVSKDLKQAEAIFKAINDSAMVFANGSTEAVNRFAYAYKQAMSAGKVSAQDFNQMNEAIPGLMDKVAESMGMSFIEMKKGLSDGSVSMDQFNEALKKLDTEGGAGMKSLEEVAKTSTGGIKTQITNAKTAVVRGVASMIEAVNQGLQKAGLGSIGEVIANAGKTMEEALKKVAPVIVNVITNLANLYKWIKQNKTAISLVVIALGSMYASFKLLTIISTISNTIKAFRLGIVALKTTAMLCGGSLSTLKASLMLLNLTFLASPIFWVIAGIIALIAVFVLLWNKCEGFRNFFIGLWEGIKSAVSFAIEFIKGIFTGIINFVSSNWQALLLFLVNPFAGAFKLLYDNCEGFRNFINNFVEGIKNFFVNLGTFIASLPGKLLSLLVSVITNIIQFGENVKAKAREIASNFLNTIVNFVSQLPGKIWNFFTSAISKVVSFGTSLGNKAKDAGNKLKNGIINTIKGLPGQIGNIGVNIARGLWNGMSGMANWVIGKVKGMGKSIIKGLKGALGIHSPSKEFAVLGKFSVLGYAEGLEGMRGQLEEAVYDTFSLSPEFANSSALHYSPNVVVNNNVSMETDPLGQTVSRIKTFAGGAKNDYNYGVGV